MFLFLFTWLASSLNPSSPTFFLSPHHHPLRSFFFFFFFTPPSVSSIPTRPVRWEAVQLPVAKLSEEVCPQRRAGATPQHAPEEPHQAPAGHLSLFWSAHITVSKCKHLAYICLYFLSAVNPNLVTPFFATMKPASVGASGVLSGRHKNHFDSTN